MVELRHSDHVLMYSEGEADRLVSSLEYGEKRGVKAISKICGSLGRIMHTCVFLATQPLRLLCLEDSPSYKCRCQTEPISD